MNGLLDLFQRYDATVLDPDGVKNFGRLWRDEQLVIQLKDELPTDTRMPSSQLYLNLFVPRQEGTQSGLYRARKVYPRCLNQS